MSGRQRPPDGRYTARQAAAELGVPEAAIRDWKHHGRVAPVGVLRGRGRGGLQPLYLLDELRPLADAYLERLATRTAATRDS